MVDEKVSPAAATQTNSKEDEVAAVERVMSGTGSIEKDHADYGRMDK